MVEPQFSTNGFYSNPLLRHSQNVSSGYWRNELAILISRATGSRLRREPSMVMRGDGPTEQIEERQMDWVYSKPVVVLDIVWNFAFVLISACVLFSTAGERPAKPLRLWIVGYCLLCFFHVGCVCWEFKRSCGGESGGRDGLEGSENESDEEDQQLLFRSRERMRGTSRSSKRIEAVNTIVSFIWWMLGFYWIVDGGQALLQDAPRLYWLTVAFMAFDVFFALFCIILACFIGLALCCCLPCLIAILYMVAGQDGASESDIRNLPKFRIRLAGSLPKQYPVAHSMNDLCSGALMEELALAPDDTECSICLSSYEDGAELHTLPCNHHFHCDCIVKWLRINATCPLCKYNIRSRSAIEQV